MTEREFFGDWYRYIDSASMNTALSRIVKNGGFYPDSHDVFKAFTLCKADNVNVVFLGQDPYPQKGVATGLAFANKADVPEESISPSLRVLKEAVIDYEKPHHVIVFDNTLEDWARQGVLLLNSSLTVKPWAPGSHTLYWRPFIAKFLQDFSAENGGMVYVLFGKQAQSFKKFINPVTSTVFTAEHPAALARKHEKMSPKLFQDISDYVHGLTGKRIEWFHEKDYGEFNL